MNQDRADRTLDLMASWGLNHIDMQPVTATQNCASAVASTTVTRFSGDQDRARTYKDAKAQLHASLEHAGRSIDLIQMHNLTQADQWETAMGPGGHWRHW